MQSQSQYSILPSLYSAVVDFINSIPEGQTYTAQYFKSALHEITYQYKQHLTYNGRWFRVRTYQSYLRRAGFISNVKRGLWKVNRHIPSWMTGSALELVIGYVKCDRPHDSNSNQRKLQQRLKQQLKDYMASVETPTTQDIKVGDTVVITHKVETWDSNTGMEESEDKVVGKNGWVDNKMDQFIGKEVVVTMVFRKQFYIDQTPFAFPFSCAEVVNKEETKTDPVETKTPTDKSLPTEFKAGDKVVITHIHEGRQWKDNVGHTTTWPNAMDKFVGKTVTLKEEENGDWRLEECSYFFPTSCMQLVTEEKQEEEPKTSTKELDHKSTLKSLDGIKFKLSCEAEIYTIIDKDPSNPKVNVTWSGCPYPGVDYSREEVLDFIFNSKVWVIVDAPDSVYKQEQKEDSVSLQEQIEILKAKLQEVQTGMDKLLKMCK